MGTGNSWSRSGNFCKRQSSERMCPTSGKLSTNKDHGQMQAMARPQHKLEALRLLNRRMGQLEKRRQERISCGDSLAEADRESAQMALTSVVEFFLDHGIESEPLVRLLGDLVALSGGSTPSDMLVPLPISHRRPDAQTVEGIKGRLAAIMEFRQRTGWDRKAAGDWVVRHLPATMKRRLRANTRAAVDNWLVKWGGQRGAAPGAGRDGYLHMRAILEGRQPTEMQLKKIISLLERKFPA